QCLVRTNGGCGSRSGKHPAHVLVSAAWGVPVGSVVCLGANWVCGVAKPLRLVCLGASGGGGPPADTRVCQIGRGARIVGRCAVSGTIARGRPRIGFALLRAFRGALRG